ncbi:MAG: YciC family protein [Bacteroidota bacterium]|nr:YciC family protein [Bacteroidota bacterium]
MQTPKYIEFKKQRELGEILSDSLAFIRNQYKPFFGTLLKIVGPYLLVMLICMGFYMYTIGDIFNFANTNTYSGSSYSPFTMVVAIGVLMLSSLAAYVMAQGTVLHYIKSYTDHKGEIVYDEIRAGVYGSFWSFIGLGFLVGLSVMIGIMFCFIPGIYLAVPLSISFGILVFLNKDVIDSYNYSFTLIKENWWITFATLFVVYIIVVIASYAFSLPAMIYMWVKMGIFSGEMDVENMNVFNDPIYLFLNILSTLVQFLMNIIFLVTTSMVFFNLNEKKNFTGAFERIDNIGKS